jgi:hypothetical protein
VQRAPVDCAAAAVVAAVVAVAAAAAAAVVAAAAAAAADLVERASRARLARDKATTSPEARAPTALVTKARET